jgi:hypothetical protein
MSTRLPLLTKTRGLFDLHLSRLLFYFILGLALVLPFAGTENVAASTSETLLTSTMYQYGHTVAISGDGNTTVVGAYGADSYKGAVYVYTRGTSGWDSGTKLVGNNPEYGTNFFGYSVALNENGNRLVVGAIYDNPWEKGAAYIFTRSGDSWDSGIQIRGSDTVANDWFGNAVAISEDGNTVVVGNDNKYDGTENRAGAAYIFSYGAGGWDNGLKITSGETVNYWQHFGQSVAISGNTVVVGAVNNDAAYFFTKGGSGWGAGVKKTVNDLDSFSQFGFSVGISGNTAFISDPYNGNQGAVYVFVNSGGWAQQQKLVASDPAIGADFGDSLSIRGTSAVIGASYKTIGVNAEQGAVYPFTFTDKWNQGSRITASDGAANDTFGFSSGVAGNTIIAGAPGKPAAYIYSISGTVPTYTITPSAGSNGSISPNTVQTVNDGTTPSFTITANAGYQIADVLVDGNSIKASLSPAGVYTFAAVHANHTIAASFAINTYTITPSSGLNGSISPNTVQTVDDGATPSFTITANAEYHIADVLVDGNSVKASLSPAGVYTFPAVHANHTIVASFAIDSTGTALEQIQTIESDFAAGVANGSLTAVASGKSGQGQLNAFANMLKRAETLIAQGDYAGAIQQLRDAYLKVDGLPKPPDTVTGAARFDLANSIMALIDYLNALP